MNKVEKVCIALTVPVMPFGAQQTATDQKGSTSARSAAAERSKPLVLTETIPLPGVKGRFDHFASGGGRLFISELGNGRIDSTLWQANSFYDALQADLTKRVTHEIEFHAAHTWGKSIDTLSATEADDAFPNGLFNQLFFDQRTSRGALVLNFTWEVPSPAASSALLKWPLSGWQFGGVYKASTGQPFTPILGGDPAGRKLDETSQPPQSGGRAGMCHARQSRESQHLYRDSVPRLPRLEPLGELGAK